MWFKAMVSPDSLSSGDKDPFKMRIAIIFILYIVLGTSCSTDAILPPDQQQSLGVPFLGETAWVRNFGGSGDDSFQDIIETSDGGYALLGTGNSTDGDLQGKAMAVNDYWLVKVDAKGELQWSRSYGGSKDDRGQAVIQTADGGYAITGYAMSDDGDGSNNEGFHDNWIVKLDASGNVEWERSFGFSGHDHSYDLLQTSDGGFFFVGFLDVTAANGEGNSGKYRSLTRHGVGEFWGTKLDRDGNLEWRRYFGGTNNDRAHAVVEAHSGGFIMAGFSESDDFDISDTRGSYDFWVIKIGTDGELVWERSFGGSGIEISYDIARTKDQAYVVVGNTFSSDIDVSINQGESDVWLIKIDDSGTLLWERTYGGSDFDGARGVSLSGDGGFVICGNSKSKDGDLRGNFGENDLWLLKTDANGQLEWQQNFGGSGLDFGFKAIETHGKDLILIGETASTDFAPLASKGGIDAVIIRIDSGLRLRE